jgi:hypothetical protein
MRKDRRDGAGIHDEVSLLAIYLQRKQQQIAEEPDRNDLRTGWRRSTFTRKLQLAGGVVHGNDEVRQNRSSQDAIGQLGDQRIVESAYRSVLHFHISDGQFLHLVELRFHFAAAADAEHHGRCDQIEARLFGKLFANHGLRSTGIDGEFIRPLAIDHHVSE